MNFRSLLKWIFKSPLEKRKLKRNSGQLLSALRKETDWLTEKEFYANYHLLKCPGVYLIAKRRFFRLAVQPLYIGKADSSVANRVNAHLKNTDKQKVGEYLATNVHECKRLVKVIPTDAPARLEAKLIKKHKPVLNRKAGESGKLTRIFRRIRKNRRKILYCAISAVAVVVFIDRFYV